MTGSILVRKVRFFRLERSVEKFTDSLDISKKGLRLTICGKFSRNLVDARPKSQPDSGLYDRLFISSSKRKSGIGFRFYRIRIQRAFILDSSSGIYDSRNFDSCGESTVDQTISSGTGDFSLDSLRSNARSLCGDCDSGFDRTDRFRKIECGFIPCFDFRNARHRIFTVFYPRVFGEGKRDFKRYYASYSSSLSIFLLVFADFIRILRFVTFDQRLEPSQFSPRIVSIFFVKRLCCGFSLEGVSSFLDFISFGRNFESF